LKINACKEAVNTLSSDSEGRIIQQLLEIRSEWKTKLCFTIVNHSQMSINQMTD